MKWKRDGETAEAQQSLSEWFAWNTTRGHMAIAEFYATLEELEAALRADGWEPEPPKVPDRAADNE